jgi:hypothetical protein
MFREYFFYKGLKGRKGEKRGEKGRKGEKRDVCFAANGRGRPPCLPEQ